jgi:hypothetical protein
MAPFEYFCWLYKVFEEDKIINERIRFRFALQILKQSSYFLEIDSD